jgi:hypothetical protein
MSDGYIYVKNWDRFQHPDAVRSSHMPWLKLHTDLLGNDAWLSLSMADRVLLQGLWMLAARYGNGRCNADQAWICGQLKVRKGSLSRLSEAGFIEVLASRAASNHASKPASTEVEGSSNEEPKKKIESARANGSSSRAAIATLEKRVQNGVAGAPSLLDDVPPHLVLRTLTEAYGDDIAPLIAARLPNPASKEPA